MSTAEELFRWLKGAVPALVLQYLIRAYAVKVCSNVSPAFAVVARDYGFMAYQATGINHFYNVVLTSDGPIKIDLSYIQFSICGDRASVRKAIKELVRNPWAAVRIEPYEGQMHELGEPRMREDMVATTIDAYRQALDDVLGLRLGDPEILDDYEDLYPYLAVDEWEIASDPESVLGLI